MRTDGIIAFSMLVFASAGHAYSARVDFDHAITFGEYRTYSWAPAPDAAEGSFFPNQLMRERIIGFVEEALGAKNLKRVTSGGDLEVRYRVTIQQDPVYTTFGDGWGPGWGWDWGWGSGISTTTVQTFYEGTLVVDLVDVKRNKLIFQGVSTQDISSKPEKNTKKFFKAVNEIFEKYPPRP